MPTYDPAAELKLNLTTGNVCAFVGAGLSMGAGLPDWYDLLTELAQRIRYELPPRQWATPDALLDATQAYVNDQGLHSLIAFLKERLDTFGKSPTPAHDALARLPISLVFTTNYDDLLERAFRQAGKRAELVVKDSNIPFMRRGADVVNIVKLYGDLTLPETIVLSRQHHEAFFLERPQMIRLLETELSRSAPLYLGWSHTDPHFNLIFGELFNRLGALLHTGYAVMFDVPVSRIEELRRKHIQLVTLPPGPDRTSQVATWLTSLTQPATVTQPPMDQVAPPTTMDEVKSTAVIEPSPTARRALQPLHRLLVELYDAHDDLTRLAEQAGIPRYQLNRSEKLVNAWWFLLTAAHQHGAVHLLVQDATADYQQRAEEIRHAYASYTNPLHYRPQQTS